jgi:putative heme-binding domain-containing protein
MTRLIPVVIFYVVCTVATARAQTSIGRLEQQLLSEPVSQLVADALETGDAVRGAVSFYQPHMACRSCHEIGDKSPLGPSLVGKREGASDEFLVESVLAPSKSIRKGFETFLVTTVDGREQAGLLVERTAEKVLLRDGRPGGKLITIPTSEIDEARSSTTSIMPKGQVNQLTSRQQFLDLVRYLIEIRDGGPVRAKELEPAPQLYQIQIPDYEQRIDHAGIIATLDGDAFRRGEAIYNRLCVNCHGTHDMPGSLPTSLRFASGKFRSGSDPFAMYQTLTRGFGMMVAQTWMVPQQKYDVIHYIREAYLKTHNPTQLFDADAQYLAGLPKGDTRGPKPTFIEPWVTMNYGPSLINTYETGNDGSNFAYKGIAVRLDPGPGGVSRGKAWMVFDHDTMRMATAWSGKGFIDWQGIHFNGRHNIHPRIVGDVHAANPAGPGWASPEFGDFTDPRIRGRDERAYGPLPRAWAHYKGLYHYDQQTVISYTVGETSVLELPGLTHSKEVPVFTRTLNFGPRSQELVLKVAHQPVGDLANLGLTTSKKAGERSFVRFGSLNSNQPVDRAEALKFNGSTFVEVANGDAFEVKDRDFSVTARIRTKSDGTILSRTTPGDSWIKGGRTLFVRGGRLCFDIGWVGAVTSRDDVADGKWHDVGMAWDSKSQQATLYVDGRESGSGTLKDTFVVAKPVVRIGFTNSDFPRSGSFFKGDLQEVRFYQRKLTAEGLKAGSSDKPLAAWALAKAAGAIVNDTSGNKHNGTVHQGESSGQADSAALYAGLEPAVPGSSWKFAPDGALLLTIPAGKQSLNTTLWFASVDDQKSAKRGEASPEFVSALEIPMAGADLATLTNGGRARWPQKLTTEVQPGPTAGAFAVDVLTHPVSNPWLAQVRLTGFDFYPDGDRMAVSAWDGDVWLVSGLSQLDQKTPAKLTWQRIASGLFQPLGVKIVNDRIHVTCRDQLVILNDLNGDGETDFYENFNNDHQVTEHFHEFAMGLQTDAVGNFYYAKSARHALKAIVPHHGTLLRVSPDGASTEIIANGFRAANGVCLNPDGSFIVTDQEGHWNPKNRINWVRKGEFYGNMFGYHAVTDDSDSAMQQPLCWITNAFDRSPAELLWCDSEKWGPLKGSLLNLSYGYGQVFVVPHEEVNGQVQGGMSPLPLPRLPTGIMRGRFHPIDGQLYTCGMFAWAGNQQQPGGFYRIRATGEPIHLPVKLNATKRSMILTFADPLDEKSATDPESYRVKAWDLKRTANYGSKHYNERSLEVAGVNVSNGGRTVELLLPGIAPTWGMEIRYVVKGADGVEVDGVVHNTIHNLGE